MSTRMVSLEEKRRLLRFLGAFRPRNEVEAAAVATVTAMLDAAIVVPSRELPRTVVSMYSTVKVVDLQRRESFTHTLVYPADVREYRSDLSLLAPMGAALLGAAEAHVVVIPESVEMSLAPMRIAVKEILHQPEWEQRNRFAQDRTNAEARS